MGLLAHVESIWQQALSALDFTYPYHKIKNGSTKV